MTTTAELTEKKEQAAEATKPTRLYTPAVDIYEREGDIVLEADMPGVDEKGVDITLEKDTLTIEGRVAPQMEGYKLVYSEYGVGDYRRVFTLSEEVDRERITATVRNGVLTLVMPKAEAAKGRKIEVKGGAE